MNRRTVKQIEPHRTLSFDQQFWPVLVAICVLCGIGFGAAMTLLNGPWMWGSLLLLPAIAATSIYLLFKLDDTFLRRSLQFAIIISMAAHLMILIIASMTSIFKNHYEQPTKQVAQKQNRVITVQNKNLTAFAWQQPLQQETPEPEVKPERQQPKEEIKTPQEIPVKTAEPVKQPQIVKRKENTRTVPRMDRQLSQLRRQTKNLTPKSSVKSSTANITQNQNAKSSASKSEPAQAQKTEAQRQAASSQVEKSETQVAKKEQGVTSPIAAQRTDRATPSKETQTNQSARASTARIRRSAPRIPTTKPTPSVVKNDTPSTTNKTVELAPSKSANQMTRQTARQTPTASNRQTPIPTLSKQTQVARSATRRQTQNQPAISNPDSTIPNPRRSSTNTPIARSTRPIESPSRAPRSESRARELNPQTTSIAKGETGVAGSGAGQNLDRAQGGAPSPAMRASDSAVRRRTESKPSPTQMLSATQRSDSRRSIAQAPSPMSALKADTTAPAKLSGSENPVNQSLEASAASIDSATAGHRGEVTAEKGESSVDVGPTKIVSERTAERRSGGGQPDVGRLNPDPTQRSNATASNRLPTLMADAGTDTVAETTPTSAPSSNTDLQPSENAVAQSRVGGDGPTALDRATTPNGNQNSPNTANESDSSDVGSRLADQLADSRQRADRSEQGGDEDDDEDEEEKRLRGNTSGRLAQAPVIQTDTDLGIGSNASGNQNTDRAIDADSSSIASRVLNRATGNMPGSLGRGTVGRLAQAATLMPLADSGSRSSRRASRNDGGNDSGQSESTKSGESSRRNNSRNPMVAATDEADGLGQKIANAQTDGTGDSSEINASSVAAERSDATQGAELDIDAVEGPAGLGDTPSTSLGVRTRPASRDSLQIQPDMETRFRNERFGGTPAVNPDAVLAKSAFKAREPGMGRSAPSTEEAIRLGLEFLARYQRADGSWSLKDFDQDHPANENQLDSDTAATGLALLAFQGAGYNHREFKYAKQIEHAIDWLTEHQESDGGLYVPSDAKSNESARLYSHAIAALALTEAYGMTQDEELRGPAQRAIDYIAKTQDPIKGGWRYFAKGDARQTDTSVTAWMMMALQSARLADLNVNDATLDGITDWLQVSADPANPSIYRYNPYAVDSDGISRQQGRVVSPSMTAVGLLMRIYTGWDKNDKRLLDGARYLMSKQMPSDANIKLRDTYYWYYATQVLKHIDGPMWEQWNNQLHPLLIKSQSKTGDMSGSWHPFEPVPDRWGIYGGRLYVTTMNLLSLEVRYRLLPLYEKTVDGFKPNK